MPQYPSSFTFSIFFSFLNCHNPFNQCCHNYGELFSVLCCSKWCMSIQIRPVHIAAQKFFRTPHDVDDLLSDLRSHYNLKQLWKAFLVVSALLRNFFLTYIVAHSSCFCWHLINIHLLLIVHYIYIENRLGLTLFSKFGSQ